MAAKKVVKEEESAVVVSGSSALSTEVDYSSYGGTGFENQDNSDIQVPFLRILQALSPEVKPVEKGGVAGAAVGKLFNTVTQECYDEVLFVPSVTKHIFNEWIPITEGGGFVATYDVQDPFVQKCQIEAKAAELPFGKIKTPDGHDLVETFDVYGILVTPNSDPMPVIVSFTSSKIKVYRKWMSGIRMFVLNTPNGKIKPDLFAHLTKISTQDEKNKVGQEYSNFRMAPAKGSLLESLLGSKDELFQAGRAMYDMVKAGIAKADMSTADKSEDGEARFDADGNKIPF